MTSDRQELLARVDEKRVELLELLCDLIQIDTTIPPGDTREAISRIDSYLQDYGIKGEVIETDTVKHNFVVTTGGGDRSHLCLNGHLDVVPVNPANWDFAPFLGAVRGDAVLGRGASDMKSGLTGLIFAFAQAQELFTEDRLTLMAVTDEERGGVEGTNRVLREVDAEYDACLIAEPTRPNSISVGQKGAVWVRFTLRGEGGHGSLAPYQGKEIFGSVSELKQTLETLRSERSHLDGVPSDLVEQTRESLQQLTGDSEAGALLDHIGVNCGKISIGTAPNAVGNNATVWCDFRIPIGMKFDHLWNEVEDIVHETPGVISHEFVKEKSPNWTHPESRIVSLLEDNAEAQYGVRPHAFLSQGSSDASYFRLRDVDTAQIGPGNIKTVHAPNETVEVDDFLNSVRTYLGFLYDWADRKKE